MIHAQERKNVFMIDFSHSAAGTLLNCLEGVENTSAAQKTDDSIRSKTITIQQNHKVFTVNISEIICPTLAEDYEYHISNLKYLNQHNIDIVLWVFSSDEPNVDKIYHFINQCLYPAIYKNKSRVEFPPTIISITKTNSTPDNIVLEHLTNVAKKLPYICAIIEIPTKNKKIIDKLKTIIVQYSCEENAINYNNPNFETISHKSPRQYTAPIVPRYVPQEQKSTVRREYLEWLDKKRLWKQLRIRWRLWKISKRFSVITLNTEMVVMKDLTECKTPMRPIKPSIPEYRPLKSESSSSSDSTPRIAPPVKFVSAVPVKNSSRAQQRQLMIERMTCKSCYQKEISAIFQPCGHTICIDCAKIIIEKTPAHCPFCIEIVIISGYQPIYFPDSFFL